MLTPPSRQATDPEHPPICILRCVEANDPAHAGITLASILAGDPTLPQETDVASPDLAPDHFETTVAPLRAKHPHSRPHRIFGPAAAQMDRAGSGQ